LIYEICGTVLSLVALHFRGSFPQNAAQRTYHEHLSRFNQIAIQVPALIEWAAIILLFLLRRSAVPLFVLAFGLNLIVMACLALTTNWLQALGAGIAVAGFFVVVEFGILLYAISLARKGVLN
jgi:hypothetical protein